MDLKIALQSGAMKPAMMQLFEDAFLPIAQSHESSFDGTVRAKDFALDIRFVKSTGMPQRVFSGEFDCGITGRDIVYQAEMEKMVCEITELNMARRSNKSVKVILAGKPGAKFEGNVKLYADREYSRLAEKISEPSIDSQVVLEICDGASEEKIKNTNDFAIVATETGSSLEANGLEAIGILMESCMVLFVRRELVNSSRNEEIFDKIQELGWLLKGVLEARPRVLLKMNVLNEDAVFEVLSLLPSLASPTQSSLQGGGVALEAVVFAEIAAGTVAKLKRAGATGIIVQDLRMVVI